jgi:hypothetical protein
MAFPGMACRWEMGCAVPEEYRLMNQDTGGQFPLSALTPRHG